MIFNEYYNIDISLNGNSLEISPNETYFSIHDSIHQLFSNSIFKINDSTGELREYLINMEGNIFSITYGVESLKDNLLKNSYVVLSDETPEVFLSGNLNGKITLNMSHEYYDKQEVENMPHSDIISNIVRKLSKSYNFKSLNIDTTQGKSMWYQLAMDQKSFIEKVLLPNSYSNNSSMTPFFAFIDNDNQFNFKSYYSLFNSSSVATLTYNPLTSEGSNINSIYDIKPFKKGSEQTKKNRNRTLFSRSTETGKYIKRKDLMSNYPSAKDNNALLPIMGKESIITSMEDQSFEYTDEERKYSFAARKIWGQKESLFLEKFIISLPFNPLLVAGKTVELKLSILNESRTSEYSLYNSGKYLIEDSIHTWEGGSIKRGTTQIIVSRKYCFIPNNYKLRSKILG